jgi:hypothetical protein
VADLAQRYQSLSQPDLCLEEAAPGSGGAGAFENGGGDGTAEREREIEQLHAKIGQLIVHAIF